MVCERGGEYDRVKVLDFGLVKSMEKTPSDPTVTSDAGIAGTPLYMAPEVLSKAGAASARSDIYALGAVMYFLLAARDLFPDRDTVAVIVAQMTLAPDALTEVAPSVPPALAELVHRCLAKDPAERPGSARELATLVRAACPSDWDSETARMWWQEHQAVRAAVPAHA
jgi:serine/threonine protein kinase